jgi:hypothetical protein
MRSEGNTASFHCDGSAARSYGNYDVKVHRSDFSKSRCDCPYEGYFKHMAAVVYYVKRKYSDDSEGATDVSDTNDNTAKTVSWPNQAPLQQPSDDVLFL